MGRWWRVNEPRSGGEGFGRTEGKGVNILHVRMQRGLKRGTKVESGYNANMCLLRRIVIR